MVGKPIRRLFQDELDPVFQPEGASIAEESEELMEMVETPAPSGDRTRNSALWLLIALTSCGAIGGIASLALVWLLSLPPVPDCNKLSPLAADMERLYCAQEAAKSGELSDVLAGLELVDEWTEDHPLYNEAQRWMEDWSESVLAQARERIVDGDYNAAIKLIDQVPPSSPTYETAQAELKEWRAEWNRGENIYAAAQSAMKAQKWDEVSAHIRTLSELGYNHWNSQQAIALSQQLLAERWAWESLRQAQKLAQTKQPNQMGNAIALVSRMDRKTHAWKAAQADLNRWGDTLLTLGLQQWQARQLDRAIATAQQVALSPNHVSDAQDLLKLSQARKLAFASGATWKANPAHIFNLMEAVAAANQISPESRFYEQAKWFAKSWEAQLQDVKQVQFAQATASLGQPVAYQAAIAQAQQVAVKRPRRVQSQTMVAYWRREMQRSQDQTHIAAAKTLAESGTISALKSAIAYAAQLSPGRPLQHEAKTLIAIWNRQIQTLEDQPTLDKAWALAEQRQYAEAIDIASSIQPGRALHAYAKTAIGQWRDRLYRAEVARNRAQREAVARQQTVTRLRNTPERQPTSTRDEAIFSYPDEALEPDFTPSRQVTEQKTARPQRSPQPAFEAPPGHPTLPSDALQPAGGAYAAPRQVLPSSIPLDPPVYSTPTPPERSVGADDSNAPSPNESLTPPPARSSPAAPTPAIEPASPVRNRLAEPPRAPRNDGATEAQRSPRPALPAVERRQPQAEAPAAEPRRLQPEPPVVERSRPVQPRPVEAPVVESEPPIFEEPVEDAVKQEMNKAAE